MSQPLEVAGFEVIISGRFWVIAKAIAGWLRNHLDAPHPWNEWMLALREYMQDVFHRLGAFPRRAAITNGNWLVVFANPENAFGVDGSREAAYVHVFANPDQIDERFEGVYKLLAQRQVAERADEIEPGHLPGMISADKVESLTHALRLYYAPTRTARQEAPVISVLPLILLKSTDNAWVRVAHTGDAILLPDKYENLAAHLNEVHEIARQLLDRVNDLVGRALLPTSIDTHYSDRAGFEGMRGIQELDGDPNHYVVVTGSMTHFLRAEPQIQDCRYHDIALVREDRLGGNLPAVFARSTLNPRTFFVSKEAHHCAHPDVHGMRSAPVTEENSNRAGQRSWGEGSAFCEIAPFEQFLCCRTCCFESVCTKSEMLRLPCRLVQIEESA